MQDMGYEDMSIHADVGMAIESVAVSRDRHDTECDSSRLEISIENLTSPVKVPTIPFSASSVMMTMRDMSNISHKILMMT